MKTSKIFILVIACMVVGFSACKTADKVNGDLPEIYVDLSKEQDFYDISDDIGPDFEIVALETNDQCVLGEIKKVVFANNRYYILNSNPLGIYIFDTAGKYVDKLDKLGRGPGEYLSLTSFAVIGRDIWIYDNTGYKIMRYNENFVNTETSPLRSTIFDVESLGDDLLLSSDFVGYDPVNYQLYEYDTKKHETKKYLDYEAQSPDILPIQKDRQFAKLNDACLFIYSYCDLIYNITADGVEPEYRFRFSQRYEDVPVTMDDYSEESKVIRGLSAIRQTPRSIILEYIDQQRPKYAIYNKATRQCIPYRSTMRALSLGGLLINDYRIEGDDLIACYYSMYLLNPMIFDLNKVGDAAAKKRFETVTSKLSEYDNPILIKFKLKPDSNF